ncbi:hypothetical protein BJX96DRAFT_182452 [Aspergillus floccosus]
MYSHAALVYRHKAEESIWVDKVNEARLNGRLCSWVSTFHPSKLPCHMEGGFLNGSYNLCQKFVFKDETTWILRLPRVSSISPEFAEEKLIMEVETLHIIREKTAIPVPQVRAWGYSKDNPLELGPFLLIDFIDGVNLAEDIRDDDVEAIYRQMVKFMLDLFQIDFDRIGSLPTRQTGASVPIRPLTWKVHGILHEGGVNTFGDRSKGFTTVSDYFQYLLGQDYQQLRDQPNSVLGRNCAGEKHASLDILKSLIPDMVEGNYSRGPFKLICDDLGLGNLIVKSRDDLTVVGVIDLEWVYAGPAQVFASGTWWLLGDRPINESWDFRTRGPPQQATRYMQHLDMFKHVLKEEETKMGDRLAKKLSTLVEWSEASGAMWLHMILSSGFFDPVIFPCGQLQKHFGLRRWLDKLAEFEGAEEVKRFAEHKERDLIRYDTEVDEIEELKSLMDSGELSREDFVARTRLIHQSRCDDTNV